MTGATLTILVASGLVALLGSGCSSKDTGAERGTAKGMIAVDGAARKATSCLLAGLAGEEVLRIRLDDGALVTVPLHEAAVYYSQTGGDRGEKLPCEHSRSDASATEGSFAGSLNRKCTGASPKVELSLVARCGAPGASEPDKQ